jgi:streptogramin lyase
MHSKNHFNLQLRKTIKLNFAGGTSSLVVRSSLLSAALAAFALLLSASTFAGTIEGRVIAGGAPIVNSTVTLWSASAAAPERLAQAHTNHDGQFTLGSRGGSSSARILYIIAEGGEPKAQQGKGSNSGIALLAVLGSRPPAHVTVNEFTTVASAFTAAQFIKGEAISGNPLSLRIAAMNIPNFVNLQNGSWGSVVIDPLNSNRSTTLATFDTLASLITAAATVASDDWRLRFFQAATPTGGQTPSNTLEAMAGIARESWAHSKDLFGLFDEIYPQPQDKTRRAAPFVPYLSYAPADFGLMLSFAGGGMNSPGRLLFDANGNMWTGVNWVPGGQNSLDVNIGGGVVELAPNGAAISPPITGFTGMGLDGVGWGTAVTPDNVWASSFNGKILVLDFNGRPAGKESDIPFEEKRSSLMGVGVAPNGDVWVCDTSSSRLMYFPGGKLKEGRIVNVSGLAAPFDVEIDAQNRVWVSNSVGDTIIRFPKDDPTKVETFHAGISVHAMAIDAKGNVWATSNASPGFPLPKVPPGTSQMMQWKIQLGAILRAVESGQVKSTGIVSMIRPDGTQPVPSGFTANGTIAVPWGINIDGNDDVWVASSYGRQLMYMAGSDTEGHPAGTKTGDLLHTFSSGLLQTLTDISIDPAGNVWAADNWSDIRVATGLNHDPVKSTWGGGDGVTVLYGAARPVKPPRMGPARAF